MRLFVLALERLAAWDHIGCAMLRSRHQPGTWLLGHATRGPLLKRCNECVLCELFSRPDVTKPASQPGPAAGRHPRSRQRRPPPSGLPRVVQVGHCADPIAFQCKSTWALVAIRVGVLSWTEECRTAAAVGHGQVGDGSYDRESRQCLLAFPVSLTAGLGPRSPAPKFTDCYQSVNTEHGAIRAPSKDCRRRWHRLEQVSAATQPRTSGPVQQRLPFASQPHESSRAARQWSPASRGCPCGSASPTPPLPPYNPAFGTGRRSGRR
jgi:hypothetical protein